MRLHKELGKIKVWVCLSEARSEINSEDIYREK